MNTYALYGFLFPKKDKSNDLKQLLLPLIEPTRQEEGCLRYDICEREDGVLLMYEVWRSKDDLDRHMQTPHMKHFIEVFWNNRMDYLEKDIQAHTGQLLAEPLS